jgi:hypothetical protein
MVRTSLQKYKDWLLIVKNSTVYDTAGAISETEAEFAVGQAELLIRRIEALLPEI